VRWLLDADVLSQPAKKNGHAGVIAWRKQEKDNCYTTAIVIVQLVPILAAIHRESRRCRAFNDRLLIKG